VRKYSLLQRFIPQRTRSISAYISAAYPPLLNRNSAAFSTAIPQLFSAFSASFAHELDMRFTPSFSAIFAEDFRTI
jgi:hypothetical protein